MTQDFDLHIHTVFSDGNDTPEQNVLSAVKKGLARIGFSDHSYTSFDTRYCLSKEKITVYKEEILRLKEKYRDTIEILCGIEQDYYSDIPAEGYDYVIGSVHYVKKDGEFLPIDDDAETLRGIAKEHFGGDAYALAEEYFNTVADVVKKTNCDIIGHFDLISKFIEMDTLFDTENPRYRAAWQNAVEKLIPYGKPFEINTGAILRGYRTSPYPSAEICEYIKARGGSLVYSSDSHSAGNIGSF